MARYLSQDWFDEVNEAAQSSEALRQSTAGADLTLQQVVTGGPEGELRYWLRIEDGTVRVAPGEAKGAPAGADATLTQPYETAVAVSRGELSTEDAFLDGSIRLRGDISVLLRHQSILNTLGGAFAEVRSRTDYP